MTNCAIRPEWSPMSIGLMILGFIVFWPLGLAMLAYILWGDRLHDATERARKKAREHRHSYRGYTRHARTGNQAFDDYREAELQRLAEERRKLDEERQAFEEFVQELRRVKDKEEFDRFMRNRANRSTTEDAEVVSETKPRTRKSRSKSD